MMSSMASRGSDKSGGQRFDADRTTAVVHHDGREIAPIHRIETGGVDFKRGERLVGDGAVDRGGAGDGGEIAHAAKEPSGDARGAAGAARDLVRAIGGDADAEHPGAAIDDELELGLGVKIQPHRNAEAVAQRIGEEPGTRGRADQREFRQIDLHRARRRALADDEVELKVLHGRIKDFLDRRVEPANSSMKRTSRSSRLVSSAARSPALAITGPEVARKLTPSSRARIAPSVVLPSPGGPTNSTWSSASFRPRAAAINTPRFLRACSWPMNSASRCGRSVALRRVLLAPLGRHQFRFRAQAHRSGPRLYLLGNNSPIGTAAAARPFGTMTRALRIIIENQLAARPAWRHYRDRPVLAAGRRMAHRDDHLDAVIAEIDEGAAERHRLGANRHAAEIGVELDAGEDPPRARAQRRADFLPVVAIAQLDRSGGGRD